MGGGRAWWRLPRRGRDQVVPGFVGGAGGLVGVVGRAAEEDAVAEDLAGPGQGQVVLAEVSSSSASAARAMSRGR